MTGRPGRGRPPTLTQDAIARAVLEIGFPNVTFAAVSERLGVGQTTLFRHAKDRDRLVGIALDYVVDHVEWPSLAGHWRDVLESYAVAAWRAWEAHPGSATEASRGITPRGVPRLMRDLCAALVRAGFSGEDAVLACDLVLDLATDNRRGVEHIDALVPSALPNRDRLHAEWVNAVERGGVDAAASARAAAPAGAAAPADVVAALSLGERESIHAALGGAIGAVPFEWFWRKLQVVLAGIECDLAPGGDG